MLSVGTKEAAMPVLSVASDNRQHPTQLQLMKHVNSIIMLRGYFSAGIFDDRIGWITVEKWKSATRTANEVTHVYL